MVKQSERVGFRLHSMACPSACSELCGHMEAVYKVFAYNGSVSHCSSWCCWSVSQPWTDRPHTEPSVLFILYFLGFFCSSPVPGKTCSLLYSSLLVNQLTFGSQLHHQLTATDSQDLHSNAFHLGENPSVRPESGRGWTYLWDYKSHLSLKWRQTLCTSRAHTAYFDCKLARPAKLLFLSAYRCVMKHLITFNIQIKKCNFNCTSQFFYMIKKCCRKLKICQHS